MLNFKLNNLDFNNFNINYFTEDNNKYTVKNKQFDLNQTLYLIKYNKQNITNDPDASLFRSVIISNNKILSYSPSKSINYNDFSNKYNASECYAEDFIDGTMINLFYYNDEWQIATKSSIGANVNFFINDKSIHDDDNITYKDMFLDCCKSANLNIDDLEKSFSYCFVIQHPKNRIVTPIFNTQLFCIKIYKYEDNNVYIVPFDYFYNNYNCFKNTNVCIPNRYPINSYDDLINFYSSENTPYYSVGIMIYNSNNGERTKIRNPNYEVIRKLRGNQPKLQYQYLCLRKENKVKDFLNYYPEYKDSFSLYKKRMHNFTDILYANYKECFIHKLKDLKTYDFQYKIHMFNIHKIYIESLRPTNQNVSKHTTINYVNNLHPAQQMFAINYELRSNK